MIKQYFNGLRKDIDEVKRMNTIKSFSQAMNKLENNTNKLRKAIKKSNQRIERRKRNKK